MAIPNHSILPVSRSDLPTLGENLHSSKLTLTINRLLFKDWPNDAVQKPLYAQAAKAGLENPSVSGFKVVDNESGDIVGQLSLTRKRPANTKRLPEKENGDGKQRTPDGMNPEVYTAVMKAVTEIAEERKGIDHFELTWIWVKSSSRRQGIGSQLVRLCLERAKAEGVPLFLGSEPAAYEFFVKHGFRDTRYVDFDLSKWAPPYTGFGIFRLTGMIWTP